MKILITGGAGFIGSAVIRELLSNSDDTVINVDKLTYAGNTESIPNNLSSKNYYFEKVDICNYDNIKALFVKYQPDAVMHLAAESHVDRSIDAPDEFIQTNVIGTYNLLKVSKEYWEQSLQKTSQDFIFHHVSTDEVYGDLPHPDIEGPSALDSRFTESTAYAPSSPYSASKASSDHLVRSWYRTYGMPIVVTNCSNNYGPYHFPEKLVPHTILNALAGKPLPIYGDGSQIRDWLYVEDHAHALIQVMKSGSQGETFNIGGHNEKRNIEVVETICSLLEELAPEKPKGIRHYRDLITYVEDRPGHDLRYSINADKIKNALGWSPQESFDSGMRKTVCWYLENEEWWQRVLSGDYKLARLGKGH